MNIYFAGSIRGGRANAPVYGAMVEYLSSFGKVLTEHVGDVSLSDAGEDGPNDRFIYERDMAWLTSSDLLVAEVSLPSLGVGYEVGYAVALEKPVLCLYQPQPDRRLSAMIAGSPHVVKHEYSSLDDAKEAIASFLKERHPAASK
jgi:2'-deoxynucleoside 5'-phosphate N-hydrolase